VALEGLPPVKVQLQLVGSPVDVSVKTTVKGAQPEVGEPLKLAVGLGFTVMYSILVSVSSPQPLLMVRLTV
jgi:ABC-type Na+ efflux pump permease subunit